MQGEFRIFFATGLRVEVDGSSLIRVFKAFDEEAKAPRLTGKGASHRKKESALPLPTRLCPISFLQHIDEV